jgi:hypothetical protein
VEAGHTFAIKNLNSKVINMKTKYSSFIKFSIAFSLCLLSLFGIQSCTKEKDETPPTLNLAYVSYDSKAQTCDFLVSANENAGIKSIEVYKDDSLYYSDKYTDRYQVKQSEEYYVRFNFNKVGFKLRCVVKDFGDNTTEKSLDFFPSIAIQGQSESTLWQPNTSQVINWLNNIGGNVMIDLFKDNIFYMNISKNYASGSKGSYPWLIPDNIPAGSNYKIRISSINIGAVEVYTNAFTILPYIILNSTINNNGYNVGNVLNLSWTDNVTENLKIQLFKGVNYIQTISEGTTNTYFNWTIPNNLAVGSDYKIKISSANTNNVFTETNYIIISNPIVKFELPSSSSNWLIGAINTIYWSTLSAANTINIELYNSNGLKYTIASGINNINNYSWTIPVNINSGYYYLKISDNSNKDKYSYSETFAISGPSIYSISPSSGSSIAFGNIPISWTCNVPLASVSIDLYRDGNLNSNLAVINNLNVGSNTFYWKRTTYNTIIKSYSGFSLRFTAFTDNGVKLISDSGTFSLSF